MLSFEAALGSARDASITLGNSKNEPNFAKTLFISLGNCVQAAEVSSVSSLAAKSNLTILEDICCAKNFFLSRPMISTICGIYSLISKQVQGYVIRDIVNSMLTLSTNKLSSYSCRECSITILGEILKVRALDCASQIVEIIQILLRHVRSVENCLRATCLRTLKSTIIGSGSRCGECHVEIMKNISKYLYEKNPEVRQLCAEIFGVFPRYSSSFSTIQADQLLSILNKGLEDEIAPVQVAHIDAVAAVYIEQIKIFNNTREQNKIGHARGDEVSPKGSSGTPSKRLSMTQKLSISKLREVVSGGPKKVEEQDFTTIVNTILRAITRSTSSAKPGLICVLGSIIGNFVSNIDQSELESCIQSVIGILHDPSILQLSQEELTLCRIRLSYIIRNSIIHNLSETQQLQFATVLAQYVASIELRTDHELQLALSELFNVMNVLGEAGVSILDDIHMATSVHLRHSSYGVRTSAAFVMGSLAKIAPTVGSRFLHQALKNARLQANGLSSLESETQELGEVGGYDENAMEVSASPLSPSINESSKKKSPKELERLQKMYGFHGHILVISILLKMEAEISGGFPRQSVEEIVGFGVDLLNQNIYQLHASIRHVLCSVVRAGGLLISSCLHVSSAISFSSLEKVLGGCKALIQRASEFNTSEEDLLYEMMAIEAAVIVLFALAWKSFSIFESHPKFLESLVECLDGSFKLMKNKYQSNYRGHFRFHTLHALLLECYSSLPDITMSSLHSQVFVESMRVFRDSLTLELDSSLLLYDMLPDEYHVLFHHRSSSSKCGDLPFCEQECILKLESLVNPLQKKESEALLTLFGQEFDKLAYHKQKSQVISLQEQKLSIVESFWGCRRSPSVHLESRSFEAAILSLSISFHSQSVDYQEKAIQLFVQAMSQVSKFGAGSSSALLFSSSEEQKKKDAKNAGTLRSVLSAVCMVLSTFPFSDQPYPSWGDNLVDKLVDVMCCPILDIQEASSWALSLLLKKYQGIPNVVEGIYAKIQRQLSSGFDKKNENMADYLGHVLLLGKLWVYGYGIDLIQDRIVATLLECMRKYDTSLVFRSGVLLSFYWICDSLSSTLLCSKIHCINEWVPLLENIGHIAEIHLAVIFNSTNISLVQASNDDLEQFLGSIAKLNRVLGPLGAMGLSQGSPLKSVVAMSMRVWRVVSLLFDNIHCHADQMVFLKSLANFVPNLQAYEEKGCLVFPTISQWLLSELVQGLRSRSLFPVGDTLEIVTGISNLTMQDISIVKKTNIDVILFEFLEWVLSMPAILILTSYSGIDSRLLYSSHVIDKNMSMKAHLLSVTKDVILSIIGSDIQHSRDSRLSFWILCFKSMILGLRVSNFGGSNNEDSQEGLDGNEGRENGDDSTLIQIIPTTSSDSIQDGLTELRDYIVARASNLTVSRSSFKTFCLHCLNYAIRISFSSDAMSSYSRECHFNNKLASNTLTIFLAGSREHSLCDIPFFAVLCLHDLVNLACAAASFTLQDRKILSLFEEALVLLNSIIFHFGKSFEAENDGSLQNSPTYDTENRLLTQYLSQLLSAIRPAFAEMWSFKILWNAGIIVKMLLEDGFLRDKVVIRRLVKSVLGFLDSPLFVGKKHPESVLSFLSCDEVSEDILASLFAVHANNSAQLYNLALNSTGEVESAVAEAILGSFESSSLEFLASFWQYYAVDAMRVVVLKESNLISGISFDRSLLDLRRGGKTFKSFCNFSGLYPSFYYEHIVDVVLRSSLFQVCANRDKDSISSLYHLNCVHLYLFCNSILNKHPNKVINFGSFSLILQGFEEVLKYQVSHPNDLVFSWTSWPSVLKNAMAVMARLTLTTCDSFLNVLSSFRCLSTICDLLGRLLQSNEKFEEKKEILDLLVVLNLSTITKLFPEIFTDCDDIQLIFDGKQLIWQPTIEYIRFAKLSTVEINHIDVVVDKLWKVFEFLMSMAIRDPVVLLETLKAFVGVTCVWISCFPNLLQQPGHYSNKILSYFSLTTLSYYGGSLASAQVTPQLSSVALEVCHKLDFADNSFHLIPGSVSFCYGIWLTMTVAVNDPTKIPLPTEFGRSLLGLATASNELVVQRSKSLIQLASRLLKSDKKVGVELIVRSLLPSILVILESSIQGSSYANDALSLAVSLVLPCQVGVSNVLLFMKRVIPLLCEVFQRCLSMESSASIICGSYLNQIAVGNPEMMRELVLSLQDSHRLILQGLMRAAILQEQEQQRVLEQQRLEKQQHQASLSPSGMKIDFSKYKK